MILAFYNQVIPDVVPSLLLQKQFKPGGLL